MPVILFLVVLDRLEYDSSLLHVISTTLDQIQPLTFAALVYMYLFTGRRSLLSQVDSRYAEEKLLEESAQALVKSSAESARLPPAPSVDISIEIEVLPSTSPTFSSPAFGEAVTSYSSLEDKTYTTDRDAFSEYQASVEAQRRSSSLKVPSKQRRRMSNKPAVAQLFKLEVS